MTTVSLTIRLDEEELEKLRQLAEESHCGVSSYARLLIKLMVDMQSNLKEVRDAISKRA